MLFKFLFNTLKAINDLNINTAWSTICYISDCVFCNQHISILGWVGGWAPTFNNITTLSFNLYLAAFLLGSLLGRVKTVVKTNITRGGRRASYQRLWDGPTWMLPWLRFNRMLHLISASGTILPGCYHCYRKNAKLKKSVTYVGMLPLGGNSMQEGCYTKTAIK